MDILTLILIVMAIGFVLFIVQMASQFMKNLHQLNSDLNSQLNQLTGQLDERLKYNLETMQATNRNIDQRLDSAAQVVGRVHEQLGRLEESSRNIREIGSDIASLQELLRAPKLRGGIGEYLLGDLLAQILPSKDFFALQYEFSNKEKVDAVIKLGERLVPVDSKFPLENFKRLMSADREEEKRQFKQKFIQDVKVHIKQVAEKYILPDEGTYDFALMYIPAENVYYETILKDEFQDKGIFEFALSKKVIPVSPNSFYAYLQVVLLGLKGLAVEKRTQEIISSLSRLRGEFGKFSEDLVKIGRHLKDSQTSFGNAEKHLTKFEDKLGQIEVLPQDSLEDRKRRSNA